MFVGCCRAVLVNGGFNVKLARTLGAGDVFILITVIFVATDNDPVWWRWSLFLLSGGFVVTKDPCAVLQI